MKNFFRSLAVIAITITFLPTANAQETIVGISLDRAKSEFETDGGFTGDTNDAEFGFYLQFRAPANLSDAVFGVHLGFGTGGGEIEEGARLLATNTPGILKVETESIIDLMGLVSFQKNENFHPYFMLGYSKLEADGAFRFATGSISLSEDFTGPKAVIGAEFPLGDAALSGVKPWLVSVSYNRAFYGKESGLEFDRSGLQVAVGYRF